MMSNWVPGSAAEVMDWVREQIKRGTFVPGQRLVEADLMKACGASRARLREALKGLAFEGAVELQEFKGAIVRRLSRDDVAQMWQLKEVVEGLAAAQCVANPDVARLGAELAALQSQLDSTSAQGDIEAFIQANDAYHALIAEGSRNKYLRKTLDGLQVTVFRIEKHLFYTTAGMVQGALEHSAITNAVLARDGAAAAGEPGGLAAHSRPVEGKGHRRSPARGRCPAQG